MTSIHNMYKDVMGSEDVYIGRKGQGQDGYFGNPFSARSRSENIAHYQKWFERRMISDKDFRRRVMRLEGKRLFCFCAPLACHGDVIIEWLERNAAYVSGFQKFPIDKPAIG